MPFPQQSGPAGSSPRMRGTLNYPSGDAEAAGIIPAYAGNTSIEHRKRRWNWDHPRVCGEHTPSARSSPLPRDHPRVCGEHDKPDSANSLAWGSSPRMRGTLFLAGVDGDDLGIIPAYAGNTCRFFIDTVSMGIIPAYAGNTLTELMLTGLVWDHPRVCGEHMLTGFVCWVISGSSPRMRGTPIFEQETDGCSGIIPAYAGNTTMAKLTIVSLRDHPRVCGEHRRLSHSKSQTAGSSPRMRGTPGTRIPAPRAGGIIPAYAGNTINRSIHKQVSRDHPRVCGEHYCRQRSIVRD